MMPFVHSQGYYARTHVVTTKQKSIDAQVILFKRYGMSTARFCCAETTKMLRIMMMLQHGAINDVAT